MVKTETYAIHPTAFIDQPVATPHQPRYAQQLPPGGSQGAVAGAGSIQRSALFHPQMGGCAARVAKLATPTGRGGSYWLAATNALHPLSQPVRAASSPKGGAKGTSCQRVAKLATPTNSEDFGLQQPMYYTPSARGGAKAALPQREAKSLPYSGEPAYL